MKNSVNNIENYQNILDKKIIRRYLKYIFQIWSCHKNTRKKLHCIKITALILSLSSFRVRTRKHDVRRPVRPAVNVASLEAGHVRGAMLQGDRWGRRSYGLLLWLTVVAEHVGHREPALVSRVATSRRLDHLWLRLDVSPRSRRVLWNMYNIRVL